MSRRLYEEVSIARYACIQHKEDWNDRKRRTIHLENRVHPLEDLGDDGQLLW